MIFILSFCANLFASDLQVQVREIGEATQFELQGLTNWVYLLKKENDKYIVRLPALNEKDMQTFLATTSKHIKKVEFLSNVDNQTELAIHLNNPDVEAFDYEMDSPNRLFLDFYLDSKKQASLSSTSNLETRSPASTELVKDSDLAALAKNPEVKTSTIKNLPKKAKATEPTEAPADNLIVKNDSSRFGLFDGGDPEFSRFSIEEYEIRSEAIIASKKNVYIKFPFIYYENSFLKDLMDAAPVYEVREEDSEENKQVRLLKHLFEKQRNAVFVKTLAIFRKNFEKSKYEHLVRYMEADVYYRLWLSEKHAADFQKAIALYKNLLKDFPKSPLSQRTELLIAYSYAERKDHLGAIRSYLHLINTDITKQYSDEVYLSIADSYREIQRYNEAINTLRDLMVKSKNEDVKRDASFKIGDMYASMADYENAIAAYQEAIKKYPGAISKYPNAIYNTAESLFWKKDYKKALDSYIAFIRNFPLDQHGGYALTRVGENLEILGANPEKIKGAFLESIFRYKTTAGAEVANMRLISKKIPNMKDKELQNESSRILSYIKTLSLPDMDHFATAMLEEGLYQRGDLSSSLKLLESFYRSNLTSPHLEFYKNRIVRNLNRQIQQMIESKKYVEALKFYAEYSNSWLKNSDRMDMRYFIGNAFEKSNVASEAEKIYKSLLNKRFTIAGTLEEKERSVFENLPSIESIKLRLANVLFEQGKSMEAFDHIKDIADTNLNSEEKVEKVQLIANLAIARGSRDVAIANLLKLTEEWKGQSSKIVKPLLSITELYLQDQKIDQAQISVDKVLALIEDTKLIDPPSTAKAYELKAEIELNKGNKNIAKSYYEKMLSEFESLMPLSSTRYKLGKIYFELGEMQKAEEVWSQLQKSDQGNVWYKIAKEKLDNAKWTGDYKKYLDRQPANQ